jgi:hypothetical protein
MLQQKVKLLVARHRIMKIRKKKHAPIWEFHEKEAATMFTHSPEPRFQDPSPSCCLTSLFRLLPPTRRILSVAKFPYA